MGATLAKYTILGYSVMAKYGGKGKLGYPLEDPSKHNFQVGDPTKYRFHLLGLAHTKTNKDYDSCAFSQKVLKMGKMLTSLGHEVYHYGAEGSDLQCTEHITCVTDAEQQYCYEGYDWHKEQFKGDPNDYAYRRFTQKAVEEINKRKRKQDMLLISMGTWQKPIADATGVMPVEMGIGYTGVWCNYRVFESYAWMHYIYGMLYPSGAACDGKFYDCVIPNYYDPEDFEYRDKKEDFYLYIGRMIPRKGIHIAVQVVDKIGAKLVIAGQGDLAELGISSPNIEYLGYVDPKTKSELMGKAKAVFVPTLYLEPFGGVNVEAQFCLPSGTMIYGDKILPIEQIQIGDKVLSHDGKLHQVNKVYERPYAGGIVKIRGRYTLPIWLTPEHPLLVKSHNAEGVSHIEWSMAKNVQKGQMVFIPKSKFAQHSYQKVLYIAGMIRNHEKWKYLVHKHGKVYYNRGNQTKYIPEKITFTHEFMRLLGYYIAEGSPSPDGVRFCFNINEGHLVRDVAECMTFVFGIDGHSWENADDHTVNILFNSKILSVLFTQLAGKGHKNKHLPGFYYKLSPSLLSSLIKAYWLGDGHCETATTTSPLLAHQLHLALLRLEVLSEIRKGGREKYRIEIPLNMLARFKEATSLPDRTLRPSNDKNRQMITEISHLQLNPENNPGSQLRTWNGGFWVKVSNVQRESYTGMVYNLEVAETNNYLANGIVVHNCGTPAITTDFGGFAESVKHGVTGYRCRTFDDFVWAANNVDKINPADCRKHAMDNYSLDRVKFMYQEYFTKLQDLFGKGWYELHPEREELDWLRKY